ncbi:hypothetical protein [Nocardia farcinica]|nr:hypothetical protein [Nocardia farcinica]
MSVWAAGLGLNPIGGVEPVALFVDGLGEEYAAALRRVSERAALAR